MLLEFELCYDAVKYLTRIQEDYSASAAAQEVPLYLGMAKAE